MGRPWQVVQTAEGLEAHGLDSPWSYPEVARVPYEHWEAIRAFAADHPAWDQALEALIGLDETPAVDPRVEAAQVALEAIADALVDAAPISPDGAPEPMPNEEHVRMIAAIVHVIALAKAHGTPVSAFVD